MVFLELECLYGPSEVVSSAARLHGPSTAVSLVLKCLCSPSEAVSLVLAFMTRTGQFPWGALHVLPHGTA